jgi:hypothetical protein
MKSNALIVIRLVFAFTLLFVFLLNTARHAVAVPIPPPSAHANASADATGGPSNSDADDNPVTASVDVISSGDDFAQAKARATVGGAARSLSSSGGASGQFAPSRADGAGRWISNFIATGTDPGNPIDLDLVATVDGLLEYLNNNSGASVDDIRSSVSLTLTLHDQSGAIGVFVGSARLATVTNSGPPQLARAGDWADPTRDGDFSTSSCSSFSCSYDVQMATTFEDVAFVEFGETFAVEFELATAAYTFAGFEVDALSDFFNTGNITVATDTPGVTFQMVPEPTSFFLLATATGVLAISARMTKSLSQIPLPRFRGRG